MVAGQSTISSERQNEYSRAVQTSASRLEYTVYHTIERCRSRATPRSTPMAFVCTSFKSANNGGGTWAESITKEAGLKAEAAHLARAGTLNVSMKLVNVFCVFTIGAVALRIQSLGKTPEGVYTPRSAFRIRRSSCWSEVHSYVSYKGAECSRQPRTPGL